MTDQPTVTLLVDAEDDVAVTRALLDAHDRRAGRVVVHPTPAVNSTTTLARDVLQALGCPIGHLSAERISTARPAFTTAASWMIADGVEQLIVLRAHLLGRACWEELVELARCAGAHLVLVQHTATPRFELAEALVDVAHDVAKDLADVLPVAAAAPPNRAASAAAPAAALAEELPMLPAGDVHRFRADAWRRLDPAGFARVDAVYSAGLEAVCRWLATHPDNQPPADLEPHTGVRAVFPPFLSPAEATAGHHLIESRLDAEALRGLGAGLLCVGRHWAARGATGIARFSATSDLHLFLTDLVADSPTRRHSVARLRGAQAGFLLHGLHLNLPPLGRSTGPGMTGRAVDDALAGRIRARIAHPVRAAALAVALFTGQGPEDIAGWPVRALTDDADALRGAALPGGVDYAVPGAARPLLVAARVFAQLRGTGPDRSLLRAGVGQNGRMLAESAAACGIPLPVRGPADDRQPWHRRAECWWVGTPLHGKDGPPP